MMDRDDVSKGLGWMLEAANPFGIFDTISNPTPKNVAQTLYYPTIMAGGAAWASGMSSMPGQGLNLVRYSALRADTYRQAAHGLRVAVPQIIRSAPVLAVGAGLTVATVEYEQRVNEPIRRSSGGSGSNIYRGPYASGS